jgi:hypothetical protein
VRLSKYEARLIGQPIEVATLSIMVDTPEAIVGIMVDIVAMVAMVAMVGMVGLTEAGTLVGMEACVLV